MSIDDLTPLEVWQIRMQAIVPIVRDMQEAFGKEAVLEVLKKRIEADLKEVVAKAPNRPDHSGLNELIGHFGGSGMLEYERRQTGGEVEVDVSSCKYAKMAQSMDAADIGAILICGRDHMHAARHGFELKRTQTRMQGGKMCDFVFAERPAEE